MFHWTHSLTESQLSYMKNNSFTPSDVRFLIVGAEKSGTTWLADMLRQHPQVFIPAQKELHYFNRRMDEAPELENYNFTKPLDWYLDFFRPAPPGRTAGEACPAYLWDEAAAERIHDFNPNVRIVMILRDPVERFISAYRYARQRGTVTAADLPTIQKKYKAFLLDRGLYFQQVNRYLDRFPRERVKICWFDDLRRDSRALLLDVEQFLSLDSFVPENVAEESNVTAAPRYPALSRIFASVRMFTRKYKLTWLIEAVRKLGLADLFTKMREENKSQPKVTRVSDEVQFDRAWLRDFYAEDISNLEKLLGVDLSKWKKK